MMNGKWNWLIFMCYVAGNRYIPKECRWEQIWTEEFLDISKWTTVSGNRSIEIQNQTFDFGQLKTIQTWTFGRFELSARLPALSNNSFRASLMSESNNITIVQYDGNQPNSIFSGAEEDRVVFPCIQNFSQEFHTFTIEWEPKTYRLLVNDVLYHEGWVHAADPMHLVLETDGKTSIREIRVLHRQNQTPCRYVFANPSDCRLNTSEGLNIEASHPPPAAFNLPSGPNRGSLSLNQVEKFLTQAQNAFGDRYSKIETIGWSVENRSITALCIGVHCGFESVASEALYTGLHHSREPMTMMVLLYTIQYLLNEFQVGNSEILALLASRRLWFVPVVNPDGYLYNQKNKSWKTRADHGQRKNRKSECAIDKDVGVDLNRNYDVCFKLDDVGSHPNNCHEDYRGAKAFSEPETVAIKHLVERHNFTTALNYHAYGKFINIPFACKGRGIPRHGENKVFNKLATTMAMYNKYGHGQSWKESNLYTVNGEASDWMWDAHRIYAMSPETGPVFQENELDGFWPTKPSIIQQICFENLFPNVYMARMAGPLLDLELMNHTIGSDFIQIQLQMMNTGLKAAERVQLVGGPYMNGTLPGPVVDLGTIHRLSSNQNATLSIPRDNTTQGYYIVMRDRLSCYLFRISNSMTQVSYPHALPLCGPCSSFGLSHPNDCPYNQSFTFNEPHHWRTDSQISNKTTTEAPKTKVPSPIPTPTQTKTETPSPMPTKTEAPTPETPSPTPTKTETPSPTQTKTEVPSPMPTKTEAPSTPIPETKRPAAIETAISAVDKKKDEMNLMLTPLVCMLFFVGVVLIFLSRRRSTRQPIQYQMVDQDQRL